MKSFFFIIPILTITLFSCDNYLNVQPEDRFLTNQIFSNEESINSNLNGIYLYIADKSLYGGELSMGSVDKLAQYYKKNNSTQYHISYDYEQDKIQNEFSQIWQGLYFAIFNTNNFLEKLTKSEGVIAPDKKDILLGEAYALRAFLHFDLLRLFGPVYITDSTQNAIPYVLNASKDISPILPANIVINSALIDLTKAEGFLKNDPIKKNGVIQLTNTDVDPLENFYKARNFRMNYYAVLALKARVYQYQNNKILASHYAQKALNESNNIFKWSPERLSESNNQNPDRSFTSEVIFGITNSNQSNMFRSLFQPSILDSEILAPNADDLERIFDYYVNDFRYRVNWKQADINGKGYKTFYKYADNNLSASYKNLLPLIRKSELYYIIAENSSDKNSAINYLNEVLKNRGRPLLTTEQGLEREIEKEYQREFWGEGQTFFYFKRKNKSSIITSSGEISMKKENYLIPIPRNETNPR